MSAYDNPMVSTDRQNWADSPPAFEVELAQNPLDDLRFGNPQALGIVQMPDKAVHWPACRHPEEKLREH